MRKLFFIWIAATVVHFAATWSCSLAGWTQNWAYEVEKILSFPGLQILPYGGGGKLANTVALFANSRCGDSCLS